MKIKEIMGKMVSLVKKEAISALKVRLGYVCAILHASLFLAGIALMSPPNQEWASTMDAFSEMGMSCSAATLAGRPFHYSYENYLLKSVILSDMPVMLITYILWVVSLPLSSILPTIKIGSYASSYVAAAIWIILGSIEWWYFWLKIEKNLKGKPVVEKVIDFVHRHQVAVTLILIGTTILIVPLLNKLSLIEALDFKIKYGR